MAPSLLDGLVGLLFLLFLFTLWRWALLKARLAGAVAELRLTEARLAERGTSEELLRRAARAEFENLAVRLIESEGRQFQETSEKGIERLLSPLKERLKDFEKRVEESYHAEGRERHLLKSEVERLILINERMLGEADNLTRALKGDTKFQGDWGELVLETILESSGLREGIEYQLQRSLQNADGERFRPDVVIQLPEGKQIVVDAKVSLAAYDGLTKLASSVTESERMQLLDANVQSFIRHADGLAERHYAKLKGINSPEFVFMFAPIEPAYLMAMRHDPMLATRAWKKGVAIVTATTLFTSLKTVAGLWRLEQQNKNAGEIADEAAKLYDKFVGFHEDFERVGKALENSLTQYQEAKRKLKDGPGNVFRKIELLRELGAAPNKRIKEEFLE